MQNNDKPKEKTAQQHKNHILEPKDNIKFTCKLYSVVIYIFLNWKIWMCMMTMVNKQWMKSSYPHLGPHHFIYTCMTIQRLPLSSCRKCIHVGWKLCVNIHKTLNIIYWFTITCMSVVSQWLPTPKRKQLKQEMGNQK